MQKTPNILCKDKWVGKVSLSAMRLRVVVLLIWITFFVRGFFLILKLWRFNEGMYIGSGEKVEYRILCQIINTAVLQYMLVLLYRRYLCGFNCNPLSQCSFILRFRVICINVDCLQKITKVTHCLQRLRQFTLYRCIVQ